MDTTSPELLSCPQDIIETIESGNEKKRVSWLEPLATDLSGNVTLSLQNHFSGDFFEIGNTEIRYVFIDSSGNSEACEFSITITAPTTGDESIFVSFCLFVCN